MFSEAKERGTESRKRNSRVMISIGLDRIFRHEGIDKTLSLIP